MRICSSIPQVSEVMALFLDTEIENGKGGIHPSQQGLETEHDRACRADAEALENKTQAESPRENHSGKTPYHFLGKRSMHARTNV